MTFTNLAATWTDQPLTDPAVAADVVDLMVSLGDRHRGTFTVLLCDPDDHYRATLTIDLPDLANPLRTRSSSAHPASAHSAHSPSAHSPSVHLAQSAGSGQPASSADATQQAGSAGSAGAAGADAEHELDPCLCSAALEPLIPAVHTAPGTGLILAVGRRGPARHPTLDDEWATAATTICRSTNTRLLGFYIATSHGVYQPTPSCAEAAA
jgi:hypothetical protein